MWIFLLAFHRILTLNTFTVTAVPLDTYKLTKPVFFGGAKEDYICRSDVGKATTASYCTDATIREYDAGHWVMLSNAVELNEDLKAWIEGLKTKDLLWLRWYSSKWPRLYRLAVLRLSLRRPVESADNHGFCGCTQGFSKAGIINWSSGFSNCCPADFDFTLTRNMTIKEGYGLLVPDLIRIYPASG